MKVNLSEGLNLPYYNPAAEDIRQRKLQIEKLRDDIIEGILRRNITTVYGKFIPSVQKDEFGSVLLLTMDQNDRERIFPHLDSFECFATPLFENNLISQFYFRWYINGEMFDDSDDLILNERWVDNILSNVINYQSGINDFIFVHTYNFRLRLNKTIEKNNIETQYKTWDANSYQSTMTFKYPPKKNSLTAMFIAYVIRRQRRNLPATKRHFYSTVLGYTENTDGGRTYNPKTDHSVYLSGHNTQFFAAISQSGILKREGKFYTLGPNYDTWKNGKLNRI